MKLSDLQKRAKEVWESSRKRASELLAKVPKIRLPTPDPVGRSLTRQMVSEGVTRIKATPLREFFLPTADLKPTLRTGGQLLQKFPSTRVRMPVPEIREPAKGVWGELQKQQRAKLELGAKVTGAVTGLPGRMVRDYGVTSEKIGRGKKLDIWDWMNIADFTPLPGIGFGAGVFMGGIKAVSREAGEKATKEVVKEFSKKVSKETLEEVGEKMGGKNPVKRVLEALKEAKKLRPGQEAVFRKARGQRLAETFKVEAKGERGFYEELSKLKGELPKVQFETIRPKVTQQDIDSLFNMVVDSKWLTDWEKISTRKGLSKIFAKGGGAIPTNNELKLLEKVFGKEFVETTMSKRPLLQIVTEGAAQIAGIPRSIMASFDVSAGFRQGAVLGAGNPRQFASAFKAQFKYLTREGAFKELQEEIVSRPTYELMTNSRLALTDLGTKMTAREEAFISSWAEKIPGIGRIVRASSRAHTGFLNKLRADVFDNLIKQADTAGINLADDPQALKQMSKFINAASGRGSLGALKKSGDALSTALFAPRWIASRIQLLNPMTYVNQSPFIRKKSIKTMLSFGGIFMTIAGLAKLAGAEVGTDPRSADFTKIKIGNTRIELTAALSQYIRLAAQLITGKIISSTTGREYTLGEGYKPITRFDILQRFFEYKTSPVVSFAIALLRGENLFGEELDVPKEVGTRFVPMVIQDTYDAIKEWGPAGLIAGIPAVVGVGVQTYAPSIETAHGLHQHLKKLPPEEANAYAKQIKKARPELYSRLKREITYEKLEITSKEAGFMQLGVGDGKRAMAIHKEAQKLKTREERNAYISRLRKAKIVTDNVYEQLDALIKRGTIKEPLKVEDIIKKQSLKVDLSKLTGIFKAKEAQAAEAPGRVLKQPMNFHPVTNPDGSITIKYDDWEGETGPLTKEEYNIVRKKILDYNRKVHEENRYIRKEKLRVKVPTKTPHDNVIKKHFGDDWTDATRVLRYTDENGDVKGENTGFQTGREVDISNKDGSIDRGLYRINSNTFKDFMKRKPELLHKNDIYSYDDLLDVDKNVKMAKIIFDEQGWDAWYAAPPDLLSN